MIWKDFTQYSSQWFWRILMHFSKNDDLIWFECKKSMIWFDLNVNFQKNGMIWFDLNVKNKQMIWFECDLKANDFAHHCFKSNRDYNHPWERRVI